MQEVFVEAATGLPKETGSETAEQYVAVIIQSAKEDHDYIEASVKQLIQ